MRCVRLRSIFQAALAISAVLLIRGQAWSQSQAWEAEGQKKVDALIKKNGSGTDSVLQKRLLQMRDEDQAIRHSFIGAPADKQREIGPSVEEVDKKLTAELKEIVQKQGWPIIRLVGIEASQAAATILNHSPDLDFQREWIPKLSRMVEEDEIVGSDLGPIIDKVLLSEGKPQLFGSVFRVEGEFMIMQPVQDPEHLDERRARYLLPPIKEYEKFIEDFYHKKVKQPQPR